MYQQSNQPPRYQDIQHNRQSQPQQQVSQNSLLHDTVAQNQNQQANGPLDKKVMVLYVQPGEPISMQAYQMVVDYPEILIQDANKIIPRPPWLTGVPTVVRVQDRAVFPGPMAFQVLQMYINNLRIMNGAQTDMVVPTVNSNKCFAVADKSVHHLAAADEKRVADVPVGQGNHHALAVGQVNFTTEEDTRYFQQGKVNEQDVSSYAARRLQHRQHPVQWKPSVLEDGQLVTM